MTLFKNIYHEVECNVKRVGVTFSNLLYDKDSGEVIPRADAFIIYKKLYNKNQDEFMKQMFILLSHTLTNAQIEDAKESLAISDFKMLDNKQWSQIPADVNDISPYLKKIQTTIQAKAVKGDVLLVQGDFGATYEMIEFAYKHELIPMYSTTKRLSKDIINEDKITTIRMFEHVMFRPYKKVS